jgi:hypothetical protein
MSTLLTTYTSLAGFRQCVPPAVPISVEPVTVFEWDGDDRVCRAYVEVSAASYYGPGVVEIDHLCVLVGTYPAQTLTERTDAAAIAAAAAEHIRQAAACAWKIVKPGRLHIEAHVDDRQLSAYDPDEWDTLSSEVITRFVEETLGATA